MHHDVAIRNIGHAKEGAGTLCCAKRHKLAQIEHVGLNDKSLRKAHVADDATGASAVFIADVARRLNRYAISDVERELSRLTDKTARRVFTCDAQRRDIDASW